VCTGVLKALGVYHGYKL